MTTPTSAPLVERLRKQAETSSAIQRQMAEAKSLRQADNPEGEVNLYAWPTPAHTLEGLAATRIAELEAQVAGLREGLGMAIAAIDQHNRDVRSAYQRIEDFHMKVPIGSSVTCLSDARRLLEQGEGV